MKPASAASLALKPSPSVLSKLGSIIVHVDEGLGDGGHFFDVAAFRQLLADEEVAEWLAAMRHLALLPVKR